MARTQGWLDTNVVLRLMVGDDRRQLGQATKLLDRYECRVSAAVLMECEWVLRGYFKLDVQTIAASFRDFLAIEHVEAEHSAQAQAILAAFEAGLDFADAVHAHQRPEDTPLISFDRLFIRRAAKLGLRGVRAPDT